MQVWSTALFELANDDGPAVFDAICLELALRMHLPLATLDQRPATAAEAVDMELVLA